MILSQTDLPSSDPISISCFILSFHLLGLPSGQCPINITRASVSLIHVTCSVHHNLISQTILDYLYVHKFFIVSFHHSSTKFVWETNVFLCTLFLNTCNLCLSVTGREPCFITIGQTYTFNKALESFTSYHMYSNPGQGLHPSLIHLKSPYYKGALLELVFSYYQQDHVVTALKPEDVTVSSVFEVILQNKIYFSCHACIIDKGVSSCVLLCRMCMSICGIILFLWELKNNKKKRKDELCYVD